MTPVLSDFQRDAVERLRTGSILCGGVGSGKSRTGLAYFYEKVQPGLKLYIITTARKRDLMEWEIECSNFHEEPHVVDSWNNINKYVDVTDGFFIFDEQRVIGSGAWVKSFYKITKSNSWILLSATPGDTWMDYIPVFVANGFYKNRTEFIRRHVVYNTYTMYPKVERYVDTKHLTRLRNYILVHMDSKRNTIRKSMRIVCQFDEGLMKTASVDRWNPYTDEPIETASNLCYVLRKICNSDKSRPVAVAKILRQHRKAIIFYNFDYELEILREFCQTQELTYSEWNGHKHEEIPSAKQWVYLVQYTAGCEGWNCIETDTIIFYSQNYSYKVFEQAQGRIDRINTPFIFLYYYILICNAAIDRSILKAIKEKKVFNENVFDSQ